MLGHPHGILCVHDSLCVCTASRAAPVRRDGPSRADPPGLRGFDERGDTVSADTFHDDGFAIDSSFAAVRKVPYARVFCFLQRRVADVVVMFASSDSLF